MRILLDECVPRPLKRELLGHDVHTVPEMGWSGKRNGELLRLMLPGLEDDEYAEFDTEIEGYLSARAAKVHKDGQGDEAWPPPQTR